VLLSLPGDWATTPPRCSCAPGSHPARTRRGAACYRTGCARRTRVREAPPGHPDRVGAAGGEPVDHDVGGTTPGCCARRARSRHVVAPARWTSTTCGGSPSTDGGADPDHPSALRPRRGGRLLAELTPARCARWTRPWCSATRDFARGRGVCPPAWNCGCWQPPAQLHSLCFVLGTRCSPRHSVLGQGHHVIAHRTAAGRLPGFAAPAGRAARRDRRCCPATVRSWPRRRVAREYLRHPEHAPAQVRAALEALGPDATPRQVVEVV